MTLLRGEGRVPAGPNHLTGLPCAPSARPETGRATADALVGHRGCAWPGSCSARKRGWQRYSAAPDCVRAHALQVSVGRQIHTSCHAGG